MNDTPELTEAERAAAERARLRKVAVDVLAVSSHPQSRALTPELLAVLSPGENTRIAAAQAKRDRRARQYAARTKTAEKRHHL